MKPKEWLDANERRNRGKQLRPGHIVQDNKGRSAVVLRVTGHDPDDPITHHGEIVARLLDEDDHWKNAAPGFHDIEHYAHSSWKRDLRIVGDNFGLSTPAVIKQAMTSRIGNNPIISVLWDGREVTLITRNLETGGEEPFGQQEFRDDTHTWDLFEDLRLFFEHAPEMRVYEARV